MELRVLVTYRKKVVGKYGNRSPVRVTKPSSYDSRILIHIFTFFKAGCILTHIDNCTIPSDSPMIAAIEEV